MSTKSHTHLIWIIMIITFGLLSQKRKLLNKTKHATLMIKTFFDMQYCQLFRLNLYAFTNTKIHEFVKIRFEFKLKLFLGNEIVNWVLNFSANTSGFGN